MRKIALPLLFLALAITASAQTSSYTTTADGCGGKALQYCTLSTVDQDNTPVTVVIDNRDNAGNLYIGAFISGDQIRGAYSGFVGNPNGTKAAYYGSGSFLSDDERVDGTFLFYAFYVGTCSGRGCGGTIGWHFKILMGSTVTVQ